MPDQPSDRKQIFVRLPNSTSDLPCDAVHRGTLVSKTDNSVTHRVEYHLVPPSRGDAPEKRVEYVSDGDIARITRPNRVSQAVYNIWLRAGVPLRWCNDGEPQYSAFQ